MSSVAMASGRRGALSVVVVMAAALAPLLLLAGVARADCFTYCFKDCIGKDKSMTDYCNYACDKTCDPGAPQRPLAAAAVGSDIGCQLSCARSSCNRLAPDCKAVESCFGACYDGCKTKPLPRPLRAGAGGSASAASGAIFPSSEPDKDDATTEEHPFHEKQDGVRPSSDAPDPDGCKTKPLLRPLCASGSASAASGAIFPSSEPDKDDAVTEEHPFHEKQDGVRPSSEAADPHGSGHAMKASSSLNSNFHEKRDGVQPASEQQRTPLP